jgi:uncharacterized protein HemX
MPETDNSKTQVQNSQPVDINMKNTQGINPWLIALASAVALIIVIAVIYFINEYMIESNADAVLARELLEIQGYVATGKLAGVI